MHDTDEPHSHMFEKVEHASKGHITMHHQPMPKTNIYARAHELAGKK